MMRISKRYLTPALVLTAGAALMALGIKNGELAEIMHKAIILCLECVGIG